MLPKIWGRYGWDFIHLVTMAYPKNPTDQEKLNYYNYFHALQHVLPCKKCQRNMANHLKKYPITNQVLSSRAELVKWGIDLHNIVNYYTGKPMLTYPEAMKSINELMQPKKNSCEKILLYVFIIIALIVICYLIYRLIQQKKLIK